uniref:DUF4359 domain-containing protein n=1 Tax=Cyanothece sp. (strain PCC 7425 / ATCC 29141) TaxID=395961 RepID=B8HRW3_CYAP4
MKRNHQGLDQKNLVTTTTIPPVNWLQSLGVLAVLSLAAFLFVTNPDETDYEEFATRQATSFLHREICDRPGKVAPSFRQVFSAGCTTLTKQGAADIRRFVSYNTQRYNFILFSLYTTDLPLQRIKILGIGRTFFLFDFS